MNGTIDQRRDVREALTNSGYSRVGYTSDHGDGVYDETWVGFLGTVVISWNERVYYK